jgi:ubiquinone biosynthesis UbiH/UbiF/VisC/COQ6 family hydroxylase
LQSVNGSQAVNQTFDAAVVGGGMVGAVAAVALRGQGLSVALVERAEPPAGPGAAGDPERVSAVNEGSRRVLDGLGLWPGLAAHGPAAIETIEVTDNDRAGRVLLDRDEAGVAALGHVIPNRLVVAAAWEALAADPGIAVHAPAAVAGLEWGRNCVRMRLDRDGGRSSLTARLVVGADSEHSAIRQAAGIASHGRHHNRYALVATVEAERDLAGRAFERFLPEGPLAFLPLGGHRASIVWTLSPGAADEALHCDRAALLARLHERFGPALGELRDVGARDAYPLSLRLARRFTARRTALVGNAAHLVHPVAGQGFNLGLRDVAALAREAGNAAGRGWDPGNDAVLARYERARRRDTARVVAFTEGLTHLFANDWGPAAALRQLGLGLMQRSGPLKRTLMNQAMGLGRGGAPAVGPGPQRILP